MNRTADAAPAGEVAITIRVHRWRLSAWDLAALVAFIALLLVRVWRLEAAPPNVSGDEVTFLDDILRILYFPDSLSPLSLMGDGSQSGLNLYFMALIVKAFPESQAILGMRLASSILSLAALVTFYLYLRSKVASAPALFAMFLLGTNYVFLNLSRASWMADGKGLGLACGFLAFLLVERAVQKGRRSLLMLGGALGGLALYGYLGTTLFPLATLAYFPYLALRERLLWKKALGQMALFATVAFIVFMPNLIAISQDYERYTLRSKSVFVGSLEEPYYGETAPLGILWHQLDYTLRGFLWLDPAVGGKGLENGRYSPVGEAPVDAAARALFLLALPTALFLHRRDLFQPVVVVVVTLAATQLLAEFPPNYARGVLALPFIYLLVAILLDKLWSIRLGCPYRQIALVTLVAAMSLWNLQHYFEWGSSPQLANERQPAIEYQQVPLWITVQKQRMAAGQPGIAITSEEWVQLAQGADPVSDEEATPLDLDTVSPFPKTSGNQGPLLLMDGRRRGLAFDGLCVRIVGGF